MGNKPAYRTCVGCRNTFDKKDLIRVIKTPEGEIVLDKTLRANGRGAYICDNIQCFNKALKNKGLARSLKCEIPGSIYDELIKEVGSDG